MKSYLFLLPFVGMTIGCTVLPNFLFVATPEAPTVTQALSPRKPIRAGLVTDENAYEMARALREELEREANEVNGSGVSRMRDNQK